MKALARGGGFREPPEPDALHTTGDEIAARDAQAPILSRSLRYGALVTTTNRASGVRVRQSARPEVADMPSRSCTI